MPAFTNAMWIAIVACEKSQDIVRSPKEPCLNRMKRLLKGCLIPRWSTKRACIGSIVNASLISAVPKQSSGFMCRTISAIDGIVIGGACKQSLRPDAVKSMIILVVTRPSSLVLTTTFSGDTRNGWSGTYSTSRYIAG
eukprot:GHVQ01038696.1.p2 GENE.GHVQ01038696.1~~GHVQ01038696.1.p2  ORF type:complete len:138 (+),score=9.30 GHVQ01038696.1:859-1272(+)